MPRTKKIDTGLEIVISEETASKLAKFEVLINKVAQALTLKVFYDYSKIIISFIFKKNANMNPYSCYVLEKFKANHSGFTSDDVFLLDDKAWILKSVEYCEKVVKEAKTNGRHIVTYPLFLALIVLAVDDTDKEKNLSTICDFARMLEVSNEEMLDLVNIVKYVFQNESYEKPKTHSINADFANVLTIYRRS